MNQSEQINELASALVNLQGEMPVTKFDSKVKVVTKTGGSYSFEYASYKGIKETCKPILLKNGIAITQLIGDKQLTTIMIHSSGQFISETMSLPIKDNMNPQEIGSVITYMKRYSYSAILGIVSDDDEDGNIASGNDLTKTAKKPTAPQKEELNPQHPKWNDAKKSLQSKTVTIETLKKHFTISAINEKNLTTNETV